MHIIEALNYTPTVFAFGMVWKFGLPQILAYIETVWSIKRIVANYGTPTVGDLDSSTVAKDDFLFTVALILSNMVMLAFITVYVMVADWGGLRGGWLTTFISYNLILLCAVNWWQITAAKEKRKLYHIPTWVSIGSHITQTAILIGGGFWFTY